MLFNIYKEHKDHEKLIPDRLSLWKHFCENLVEINEKIPLPKIDLLFDAQTSGGLIIALPEKEANNCLKRLKEEGIKEANIIGQVLKEHQKGKIKIIWFFSCSFDKNVYNKNAGAIWVRRGYGRLKLHAGVPIASWKKDRVKTNANDYAYALAA